MPTNLAELERRLWDAADDLRANSGLKASEYGTPMLRSAFISRFSSSLISSGLAVAMGISWDCRGELRSSAGARNTVAKHRAPRHNALAAAFDP